MVRLAMSAGDIQLCKHWMHNKLFIADNAVAIYGGRHVADEYFMKNDVANLIDFDAISTARVRGLVAGVRSAPEQPCCHGRCTPCWAAPPTRRKRAGNSMLQWRMPASPRSNRPSTR